MLVATSSAREAAHSVPVKLGRLESLWPSAERDVRIIGACSGFPQPCFRRKRLQLLLQGTGARCSHMAAGLVYCYNCTSWL